jgi:FMN reductase (NADPH)/FMN reductase [NAD(P)H]
MENPTLRLLMQRKSVRAYTDQPVLPGVRDQILVAAMRSPTAGNMMMYSIIEVSDQGKKDRLVDTCDHQPFIATAPLVLLFLADCQRWQDYYRMVGVEDSCVAEGMPFLQPEAGDLLLACCDALIAAQTATIAAESLGLGSCYIGDILENYEIHREMFDLPEYVIPIAMLCIGYPTEEQHQRKLTDRFDRDFICFEDTYRRLTSNEYESMFQRRTQLLQEIDPSNKYPSEGHRMYQRKFSAEFMMEMRRSVRAMLRAWEGG